MSTTNERLSKRCSLCKQEKSPACFSKHRQKNDGLNSWCRDCAKIKFNKYFLENRKKMIALNNEASRRWRRNNPDRSLAATNKWKKKNPAIAKAIKKRCRIKNKHKAYVYATRRKKHIKLRTPKYANLKKIYVFYWIARELTKVFGVEYHVDHIIPLRGDGISGLHHEGNLQVMLGVDNVRKGNNFSVK